ncbi:MAG: GPW/gp25 family protein [Proteobacteria bacterium]|nr:GPW/gp25 family protein [Pseudomonadota bacterium]
MSREYLGRGWSFPVRPREDDGGVALSEHERNITECIHIILNTQPGERQMLPEFGCPLQDLIFSTNSSGTRHQAESMVRSALATWEPRIDVDEVAAKPDPENPNQIRIHVGYTVRRSNNHQNLVHLVQLQEFIGAD